MSTHDAAVSSSPKATDRIEISEFVQVLGQLRARGGKPTTPLIHREIAQRRQTRSPQDSGAPAGRDLVRELQRRLAEKQSEIDDLRRRHEELRRELRALSPGGVAG